MIRVIKSNVKDIASTLTPQDRMNTAKLADLVEQKAQLEQEEVRDKLRTHEPKPREFVYESKYGTPNLTKKWSVNQYSNKEDTSEAQESTRKLPKMRKIDII